MGNIGTTLDFYSRRMLRIFLRTGVMTPAASYWRLPLACRVGFRCGPRATVDDWSNAIEAAEALGL